MPADLPDWFLEKYSKKSPAAIEQPVEERPASREDFLRKQSMSLDIADTQQEREQLEGNALSSTRRKIDPATLERLSNRFPANNEPFSQAPVRKAPTLPEGKRVFTDQAQVDQIVAEAPAEGRPVSFKGAFKNARSKGLKEFRYRGDLFNTQDDGETDSGWLDTLKTNKDLEGVDERAKAMIKHHESLRLNRYSDSSGRSTIGYGHLLEKGEGLQTVTAQDADRIFEKDYADHKKAAEQIPGYEIANGTRRAALIDLTFNMGPRWHKKFPTFTKAFAAGDYEKAANGLVNSKWRRQVGDRADRIIEMIREGSSE